MSACTFTPRIITHVPAFVLLFRSFVQWGSFVFVNSLLTSSRHQIYWKTNILRYYLSIHSQESHSSENSLTLIAHQGEALSVKMRPFSLESEARWISQQSHRRKWDRVFSYLKRRLWDSGKIHNQTRAFHVKFNLQNRYRTHRFAQPAYLRLSRAPPKTTAGNTSAVKGHAIRAISVFNDTLYKKECISRMR